MPFPGSPLVRDRFQAPALLRFPCLSALSCSPPWMTLTECWLEDHRGHAPDSAALVLVSRKLQGRWGGRGLLRAGPPAGGRPEAGVAFLNTFRLLPSTEPAGGRLLSQCCSCAWKSPWGPGPQVPHPGSEEAGVNKVLPDGPGVLGFAASGAASSATCSHLSPGLRATGTQTSSWMSLQEPGTVRGGPLDQMSQPARGWRLRTRPS